MMPFVPPPLIKEHLERPPRRPEVRASPVLPCSRALGLDRLGAADKLKDGDTHLLASLCRWRWD